MKFEDVTEQAGLSGAGYSMGGAAADFDNDGAVDLFVAGVRSNHLYRNLGNGKFEEVTAKAGIRRRRVGDHRRLVRLRQRRPARPVRRRIISSGRPKILCSAATRRVKIRAYCHPRFFEGQPNVALPQPRRRHL